MTVILHRNIKEISFKEKKKKKKVCELSYYRKPIEMLHVFSTYTSPLSLIGQLVGVSYTQNKFLSQGSGRALFGLNFERKTSKYLKPQCNNNNNNSRKFL